MERHVDRRLANLVALFFCLRLFVQLFSQASPVNDRVQHITFSPTLIALVPVILTVHINVGTLLRLRLTKFRQLIPTIRFPATSIRSCGF